MKVGLTVPGGVDRSGSKRVIPCLLSVMERLTAGGIVVAAAARAITGLPVLLHVTGSDLTSPG